MLTPTIINIEPLLIGLLMVINTLAFIGIWRDKRISTRRGNARRTSEGLIFFWAAMFGSVGVYLGMYAFRHKTHRWYFQLGIPLLIIQNTAILYLVYKFFTV